jgi:predicted NAD-dependent protein-ADP-ribosyltransferase YbiA (DUF1768 family)
MSQIRNWFSNFVHFEKPLIYQGITYISPEHFYQAMKTKNISLRRTIAQSSYPKQDGNRLYLRPNWDYKLKIEYMKVAIRHKFKPGTKYYYALLASNPYEIVEYNDWHDTYWGVCICGHCPKSKNMLGKIIMEWRDIILKGGEIEVKSISGIPEELFNI